MPIVSNPFDFVMKEVTDRTIEVNCKGKIDDNPDNDIVLNITGWQFYFEIREDKAEATHYIRKTSAASTEILLTAPTNGQLEIYILYTDFSTAPKYNVAYTAECFGVTPGGKRYDIGEGTVKFTKKMVVIP